MVWGFFICPSLVAVAVSVIVWPLTFTVLEIQFDLAIKPGLFAMVVFMVRVVPFMSYVPPLAVNCFM
jgi:hypothetical protein